VQSIASSAAPDSKLATPPQLQSRFKTLALMILVALLLRLAVMIFLLPDQLDPARDHWKFGYETGRIARSIVTGKGFSSPLFADTGPTAWMTPIYPYVVAAVFKVFGIYTTASAVVLLTLNALLSALTCIPIFLFADKSFGPRTAIWSGWTWVFFPYAIYFPVERIWETWLATLLFAFLFLMALNLSEGRSLKLWGAYGLLWGIAALTSPSVLAVLPFLGGWIVYRLWRSRKPWFTRNLLAGLIFVAVVSPWFIRNYRVFHRVVPFRDNMGMVLRLGTKGKTSYWGTYDLGPWHNDAEWQQFQKLGELGYMEKEEHQAFLAIRANPGWYLWTSFRRAVFIWTGYWSLDREYLAQEPFDPYNIPLCTALTMLALIGLRRAFQQHLPFGLPYALLLLTFPLIYYFTSPEVYYRRPLDPMILALAIFALAGRKEVSDISAPVLCAEFPESQEPRSVPAQHL
jgi:4-amino-4-deoxy-L-arabinose transferase-like glycosyltransferase